MSRFVSATVITIMITSKITIGIQGTIITIGVIGITMEMGSIAITEDITTTTRIKGTKERLITSTVAQNRAHSAFLAFRCRCRIKLFPYRCTTGTSGRFDVSGLL